MTLGIGQIDSDTGFGLGYAYRFKGKEASALTFGIGTSGGETVAKGGFSFEF